jgi:serine/threonine-protein kinase SRPK3
VVCVPQFFELLTSDVLFEPAERPGAWSRDDDHICQMIELLGHMSPEFALSGDYSKDIFRSDGESARLARGFKSNVKL